MGKPWSFMEYQEASARISDYETSRSFHGIPRRAYGTPRRFMEYHEAILEHQAFMECQEAFVQYQAALIEYKEGCLRGALRGLPWGVLWDASRIRLLIRYVQNTDCFCGRVCRTCWNRARMDASNVKQFVEIMRTLSERDRTVNSKLCNILPTIYEDSIQKSMPKKVRRTSANLNTWNRPTSKIFAYHEKPHTFMIGSCAENCWTNVSGVGLRLSSTQTARRLSQRGRKLMCCSQTSKAAANNHMHLHLCIYHWLEAWSRYISFGNGDIANDARLFWLTPTCVLKLALEF